MLIAASVLLIAVVAGLLGRRSSPAADSPTPDRAPTRLEALRQAVDSCAVELAAEQALFRAHQQRVDSLRAVVEGYESPERTVPAEEFETYVEAFDAYNASVEGWNVRAAAVRAQDESCRALIQRHNALVDSLSAAASLSAASRSSIITSNRAVPIDAPPRDPYSGNGNDPPPGRRHI